MYYNQTIIVDSDNFVYIIYNYSLIFLILYCLFVSIYSYSCKFKRIKK